MEAVTQLFSSKPSSIPRPLRWGDRGLGAPPLLAAPKSRELAHDIEDGRRVVHIGVEGAAALGGRDKP